jgi:transposase
VFEEKRRKFASEFKREAVRLLQRADEPTAAVARELGIPRNRLYKCAEDAERKGEQAFGRSAAECLLAQASPNKAL